MEDTTELPDDIEFLWSHQDLFLTGTGCVDIDRWEDSLICELSIEFELHVSGALELLEDDLIHLGSGLDKSGRKDGQ
ncbi:unannotated protein [freshwater metagenome]|uniref:Unannotated protein n=1 Tax=freshwater metagenome TaxID=449393 RepID=A0A6J6E4X8_9ZZZZ